MLESRHNISDVSEKPNHQVRVVLRLEIGLYALVVCGEIQVLKLKIELLIYHLQESRVEAIETLRKGFRVVYKHRVHPLGY